MKKQKVTTQKPKLTYRVNEQIRVPEVRIIFPDGTQEVMKTIDAKRVAEERNQDLIEVQPNAEPPVCKFDNLGRLLYKMDKRDKDLKKKQKTTTLFRKWMLFYRHKSLPFPDLGFQHNHESLDPIRVRVWP